MGDEQLFLDELFKDECDHIGEKTCVEDLKLRALFEIRKLGLRTFIFDEPTNSQSQLIKALKTSLETNPCV